MARYNQQDANPTYQYKETITLDKKDKKILLELLKNTRQPVSSIAKKVCLSKDAVDYRIERLHKKGYLYGFTTVTNFTALGYTWQTVFLKIKYGESKAKKELLKLLKENNNILKVMKLSGSWDLQLDILTKHPKELQEIIQKLKNLLPLIDIQVLTILKEHKYLHVVPHFLSDLQKDFSFHPAGRIDIFDQNKTQDKTPQTKLDKTDHLLLALLNKNARTQIIDLAKELNVSSDTVIYRIKRLQKNNIIKGFMPVLNSPLVGYDQRWVLLRTNTYNKKLLSCLNNHPFIQTVLQVGYNYDLLIWISTPTVKEFQEVFDTLIATFSDTIGAYEVMLALEEYKYSEYPGSDIAW